MFLTLAVSITTGNSFNDQVPAAPDLMRGTPRFAEFISHTSVNLLGVSKSSRGALSIRFTIANEQEARLGTVLPPISADTIAPACRDPENRAPAPSGY
ncbi:hypothetical protein NK8_83240 (plasmid) [Caballeronia sp. NK8]|nr:hypothetical protein NK8_83240 [Caballeronia sp. NK8]